MDKGVACQPFGDVLVVGRRPTFVRAVREKEERNKRNRALGDESRLLILQKNGMLCVLLGRCKGKRNNSSTALW